MSIPTTSVASNTVGSTGAAVAFGTAASKSLSNTNSLLSSTINQLISGDYTLYVSDIVSLLGVVIGAVSIGLTVYKMIKGAINNG